MAGARTDISSQLHLTYCHIRLKHIIHLCQEYGMSPYVFDRIPHRILGLHGKEIVFATGFLEDGSLEDLIFVQPKSGKWRLALGHANWLGQWHMEIDDLRRLRSPMHYLQTGGIGVFPLNKSAEMQLEMLKLDLGAVA
jgi:hypothetical protein